MDNSDQFVPEKVLNILSGNSNENPFPLFAQMRSMGSVISIPNPMDENDHKAWMVMHMEEAVQVLKDNKRFTVDPTTILMAAGVLGRALLITLIRHLLIPSLLGSLCFLSMESIIEDYVNSSLELSHPNIWKV